VFKLTPSSNGKWKETVLHSFTLGAGLDPSVDQAVIATVRQWLFTPATKDGVPVVSEQEFHFHYERG
jgi:protein TonB